MSKTLPFGRAIIHRATGRIVGPIAPIATEDWPFLDVPKQETLWRYMDTWKFEDFLESQTLFFARPDQFEDPFEGRFSLGNLRRNSKSDEIFRSLYSIRMSEPQKYHEIHRNVVFISCWHRNRNESRQMWNAYTKSPDSVVVTTSVNALKRFLPERLMKFGVKYAPLEFPRTEFCHNALFFYKPEEYAFEREFRLLRSPNEDETFYSENPDDRFRRIPIQARKLVHRVITHPRANAETKAAVERLLRRYLSGVRRQNSSLLR